jgi:hypothetical protein
MLRLFFDFENARISFYDEEGIDFPNVEAGRSEVLLTLAQVVKDAIPNGDHQSFTARVRDASGNSIYSARVTVAGTWHGSKRQV